LKELQKAFWPLRREQLYPYYKLRDKIEDSVRGLANLNQLILASPTTGIHPFKTLCIFKIFFPEKQIEKAEVNKLISSVVHVEHCYSN